MKTRRSTKRRRTLRKPEPDRPERAAGLIFFVFGLSGAAALIHELVWLRSLQFLFGSTVYTASAVLSTFLLGFSLGSWLFGAWAERGRRLLFAIGIMEILIGLYGFALYGLFQLISFSHPWIPAALWAKFALTVAVLGPPTTLLGAIWPLISQSLIPDRSRVGRGAGGLYSVNSFGSALGAFAGGFVLIPLAGLTATAAAAAAMNLFAGVLLIRGSRSDRGTT